MWIETDGFSLRYIDDVKLCPCFSDFIGSIIMIYYDCGWECPFANCFDVNARISRF